MSKTEEQRKEAAKALVSYILHKHYCENNSEAVIALLSKTLSWFGAAEHEYLVDYDAIVETLRQFTGKVPPCLISQEHYDVLRLSEDVYLCTGMLYVSTDPGTNLYIRVHQRVTMIFRWEDGEPKCCHIHLSNPYEEMHADDVGFPTATSRETRRFMLEELGRKTMQLERLSYEDMLTGLYNRNKFNQLRTQTFAGSLGVAVLDLNGLKQVNDKYGHDAGDTLITRTARNISAVFPEKCYRIGGDEFVVVAPDIAEELFRENMASVQDNVTKSGDAISIGISWREQGDFAAQFREADQNMYENKRRYYMSREHNRRKR